MSINRQGKSGFTELSDLIRTQDQGFYGKYRRLAQTRLFPLIVGILLILLGFIVISVLEVAYPKHQLTFFALQLILGMAGFAVISLLLHQLYNNHIVPLADTRIWAQRMKNGELSARIPLPPHGDVKGLAVDINKLAEDLQHLSVDMDAKVRMQTSRLANKSRSLEILYDIAATLNASRDLDDLLSRFLYTIKDLTDARAAAVRLVAEDDKLRLVNSVGLDDDIVEKEQLVPSDRCICGMTLTEGRAICQKDLSTCSEWLGRPMFEIEGMEMLAIPLQYRGQNLGVYNLFLDKSGIGINSETRELLTSIGRHLGMAIDKARLDKESHRLSIMQERTMLANELHDSLAQTLASMRFQVKALDEYMGEENLDSAKNELNRLSNGISEAHTELRELLSHFRAPLDKRGLIPALEGVINRFKRDTGIAIFLQRECDQITLPDLHDMQILRIVQESLANIRKHSEANAVRVLIRCDAEGEHLILIEDDGVGVGEQIMDGHPGEHIGLAIMQERASRINGNLKIESEQGEGTRVELRFTYKKEQNKQFFPED